MESSTALQSADVNESNLEYPFQKIRDLIYFKGIGRYCFEVEWVETDPINGKPKVTSEPLEHVMSSGRALFNFEMRQLSAARLARRAGRSSCTGRKAKLPFPAVNRKRFSHEFIPTGEERVKSILTSMKHDGPLGRVYEYYLVRFKGDQTYRLVRQIFLEYYFPLDLVLYWKSNKLSGPKFQNAKPAPPEVVTQY